MRTTYRIRKHELGLLFQHGDLVDILDPGAHRVWNLPFKGGKCVEILDTLSPRFEHERLGALVRDPMIAERLTVVDLNDEQRALVWADGRLIAILGAGIFAFWNGPAKIVIEQYSVNDARFEHDRIESILGFPGGVKHFDGVRVDAHERVMLFRDGSSSISWARATSSSGRVAPR